jgi:chemotaxis protein methyltransferase CheR
MARIVARFSEALRPGGYLFLGHAETLRGISQDFIVRHEFGTFFYERSSELSKSPPSETPFLDPSLPAPHLGGQEWFDAVSQSTERIATLSQAHGSRERLFQEKLLEQKSKRNVVRHDVKRLTAARDLMQQERFHDALQLISPASETGFDVEEDLLRAMLLVSTGGFAEAADLCEKMLHANNLTAGAHYIWSLCEESFGDIESATRRSRTAVGLDPEFAMPHLQLGRLARRARDYSLARVELQLALRLLHQEAASRILLFGGGFNRSSLIRVCEIELAACERAS